MKHILKKLIQASSNGDTIVEVLLAIGIASFAIGTTYATAQRSLHTSITAKEHNEALNIVENQISDIKLRFQNSDANTFNTYFAAAKDFCLDNLATVASPSKPWTPYTNPGSPTDGSALAFGAGQPYDSGCHQPSPGNGFNYFINIVPVGSPTSAGPGLKEGATYLISVRWEQLSGSQANKVSEYYRVNGGTPATLGAVPPGGGGVLPSPGGIINGNLTVMSNPNLPITPTFELWLNDQKVDTVTYPVGPQKCNNPSPGAYSTPPLTSYTGGEDVLQERCQDVAYTFDATSFPQVITKVAFRFTGDSNGCEPGYTNSTPPIFCDEDGYEDNNLILHSVTVPGRTVTFNSYNANLGLTNEPPAVPFSATVDNTGGPSYHLWILWGTPANPYGNFGTAFFDVN